MFTNDSKITVLLSLPLNEKHFCTYKLICKELNWKLRPLTKLKFLYKLNNILCIFYACRSPRYYVTQCKICTIFCDYY